MAGLNVMPEPVAAAPAVGAPGAPPAGLAPMGMEGEGTPASPEEQAMFDTMVSMAVIALYDKKLMGKVVAAFRQGDDIADEIAEVAANLSMRIVLHAKEQGTDLPGDVILNAGKEIVEAVAELAEAAGAQVDEATLEQAWYNTMDRFRVLAQQQGLYSEAAIQEDSAAFQGMAQDGRLQALLQGIGQARAAEGMA